jgi:hypothetical protein
MEKKEKKMKIALITIHDITNYGTMLQAFATKEILSRYGEVETINYFRPRNYFHPRSFNNRLEVIRFRLNIRNFRSTIRNLRLVKYDISQFKDRSQLIRKFKKFLKSNLNLTKLVTRHELQNGVINDFNVYVCGSDQIWSDTLRTNDEKFDRIYFLSFVSKKAKKISYASSMGECCRFTDSEKAKVKDLLKDFKAISVRESDAQEMLSPLLEREVFHVLDPTLLLTKEEWFETLKIDKSYRSIKEDYILVYQVVAITPLIKEAVEFFVQKFGMKVVFLGHKFESFINEVIHIKDAGPLDFIELFANANFVITDSFHGTCFSVNFKKPFVSVCPVRGANRIESLLNLLGLENRFIDDEKNIHKLSTDFSYELAEKKLEEERAKSIKFLRSNIEKVNG